MCSQVGWFSESLEEKLIERKHPLSLGGDCPPKASDVCLHLIIIGVNLKDKMCKEWTQTDNMLRDDLSEN